MNDNLSSVNLVDAPVEICECGNKFWVQSFVLKRLSSLISPTGNPELVPIPLYICSKCGQIAPVFKNDPKFDQILCNNVSN